MGLKSQSIRYSMGSTSQKWWRDPSRQTEETINHDHHVRVNAVAPGPVQTAMLDRVTGNDAEVKEAFLSQVPQGRAGDPEEIAEAIAFITSDQAGFLTGQTIFIDGGITAT
jgi:NAD(P)-dependent dehydrogenase (short-subunit alcohol dehydrogenase family)